MNENFIALSSDDDCVFLQGKTLQSLKTEIEKDSDGYLMDYEDSTIDIYQKVASFKVKNNIVLEPIAKKKK